MDASLVPAILYRSELMREYLVIEPCEFVLLCKTFAEPKPVSSHKKTRPEGLDFSWLSVVA